MAPKASIAVVGSGAAGLGAAWLLARGGYSVHLYEANAVAGGHANTVDVPVPGHHGATIPIDTGFVVYNTRTYPDIVSLFQILGVEEENSSMSFAASIDRPGGGVFEWGSEGLSSLFADRSNLYRPAMYTMLYDMRRFNNAVYEYLDRVSANPASREAFITLGEFLDDGGYSQVFIQCYLVPMVSAVWSASFYAALLFPANSLFHFFVNHGLAQVFARPQWRTPAARSRDYVSKILADMRAHGAVVNLATPVTRVDRSPDGVTIYAQDCKPRRFDQVVFGTHPPTTLKLLGAAATDAERRILGAFKYAENKAYVHHDVRLMPNNHGVWSSWNFIGLKSRVGVATEAASAARASRHDEGAHSTGSADNPVCVTYWLNRLQNLHRHAIDVPDLFITLNPVIPIDESKILAEMVYEHPQFTCEAVRAQLELQDVIQGENRSWFCGAFARYGFHEDAMMMGLDVAERLSGYKVLRPWRKKASLAINNNYRVYEMPFPTLRAPFMFYMGALAVINVVRDRLQSGLAKLAVRMSEEEPVVIVAGGDGRLQRFGHRRPPGIGSSSSSSSSLTMSSAPHISDTSMNSALGMSYSRPARVTVRSPKVYARMTEALRQGHALAIAASAAFAANEMDCPTPEDLSVALRALFITQCLETELTEGRRGQTKLAEGLLSVIVGGFDAVCAPETQSRLPELTTSISSVVYPAWWLLVDNETAFVSRRASTGSGLVDMDGISTVSPGTDVRRTLELVGDLSEATIAGLQSSAGSRATIVVLSSERAEFVRRKAELLAIDEQVDTVLIEAFMASAGAGCIDSMTAADVRPTPYDLIVSPAAVNICEAIFGSIDKLMILLRSLISDSGRIELGVTVYDGRPSPKVRRQRHETDSVFCGDTGFRIWPEHEVEDAAVASRLKLEALTQMEHEDAASDVRATIERVHATLAEEMLSTKEIRQTMAQFCLWEAALHSSYANRAVALLRPL